MSCQSSGVAALRFILLLATAMEKGTSIEQLREKPGIEPAAG
jgi:hypothetical protein